MVDIRDNDFVLNGYIVEFKFYTGSDTFFTATLTGYKPCNCSNILCTVSLPYIIRDYAGFNIVAMKKFLTEKILLLP